MRQVKYIIGNEACERFSYYGVLGILELYLKDRMKMGGDGATEVVHYFGTAVYFLPLFGGWLADRYWGRYLTILSISLFYCLGHGCMAAFGATRTGLFCGLALLAIGAGGIKPCVSALVGDQFEPQDERALTKVYGWFYWAINLGAAAAFFIIPIVRREAGYRWAFGIPGIFMALATLIFWLGRNKYVRRPPSKFSDFSLADFKSVRQILMIFVTVPMFWALFNQVNTTWVLQGNSMVPCWKWKNDFLVNGETMQSAGAVLVMIWVPILTFVVYPALEKIGLKPTALRRMSAGMVLAAVAFVGSGLLQAQLDRGARLSIAWQLVPYVFLEAGEVMLSATALEFAFSQAPAGMKSIITSFWLMTIAGGHFLVATFTGLNEKYIHAHGASQFYFFAVLMFVVAGIFIGCAVAYRPLEVENTQKFV
ncbi:MAG TPA: MFS transporter [Verrucomicrobiae bacterium]|nr:MFS transporter [Verrucomicrobiae bacterium]